MGDDAASSAVDSQLRVRGVDSVRVIGNCASLLCYAMANAPAVDASVLPSLVSGDNQATEQALARIAADIILDF